MKPKPTANIKLLLDIIDESYEKKAWHGPNLRGSIRGLTARQAAHRPSAKRHNIWEIVVHCAYWKYVVRRKILGGKRGSFALEGSNWFTRPEYQSDEEVWRNDMLLLENEHRELREVIARLSDSDLKKIPQGSKVDNRTMISGIASHDVYHAGQIQLLKRFL